MANLGQGEFCLPPANVPNGIKFSEKKEKSFFFNSSEKEILESKAELKAILNFLPDATFAIDLEGKVILWNQSMEKLTSIKAKDIIGKNNYEYALPFYGERRPILIDLVLKPAPVVEKYSTFFSEGNYTLIAEAFCPNIGESGIYAWAKASRLYDNRGNLIGAIESIRDISARKQIEKSLRISEERYRFLVENANEAVVIVQDNMFKYVNPKALELFGVSEEELLSKEVSEFIHPGDVNIVLKRINKRLNGEIVIGKYSFRIKAGDGSIKWAEVNADVIEWEGRPASLALIDDITDRKQAEERISYLSFHDSLTGLYNRCFLEEEMQRLDSERQHPISIIMVDVNGLKLINDTYGHKTGDELLSRISIILKNCCRKEDIIVRWGGDEFVIFLPQTKREEAKELVKKIREESNNFYVKSVPIKIALGRATKENFEESLEETFKKAEDRMYQNKLTETNSARSDIISALLGTLKEKSDETEEHARRMIELGFRFGEALGLKEEDQDKLSLLATMHDIGKVTISEEILKKPGKLTDKEWEKIKEHPETGQRIARTSENLIHIAEEILSHHERWDGKGYPNGLKGEEIPFLARIISIIDAFDVMTNGRIYKSPLTRKEALKEIKKCAGIQFDPNLVQVFLEIID